MKNLDRAQDRGEGRLNILQAMHFPLEGAGTGYYVHNLASGLVRGGNKVGVVHAQSPGCTRSNTPYERFPVDFKAGNLKFPFPVFESHPLGGDLNFGSIRDQEYIAYCQAFEGALDEAIDRVRPDVVNVHHGWKLGEMLDRKGIPYFVTLHGTEAKAFDRYPAYQAEVLRGLKGAQGIIVLTEDQRQTAREKYGIEDGKISTITSGIDTDFFVPQSVDRKKVLGANGVELDRDQPVVLYVGRLTEVKGVNYLVDAATHFEGKASDPKIVVAGDGILRNQLAEVKREHGLTNLSLLGLKNPRQVLRLYNAADLVVVPSLSECFPLVPAEGMACGVPFVSTNIPGGLSLQAGALEEVVNNGPGAGEEVSVRVPPRTSGALASKINEILNLDLKRRIGESIRGSSKRFSLSEMIAHTRNLYSGVVGSLR